MINQAKEKRGQEAFHTPVLDDKKKGVSKKSLCTLGFWDKSKPVRLHQFQARIQDEFQLYAAFGLAIIMAQVISAA